MKIIIKCTAAEQEQIKRNLKVNQGDTEITYTQSITDKPRDMTCGEYVLSKITWEVTDK